MSWQSPLFTAPVPLPSLFSLRTHEIALHSSRSTKISVMTAQVLFFDPNTTVMLPSTIYHFIGPSRISGLDMKHCEFSSKSFLHVFIYFFCVLRCVHVCYSMCADQRTDRKRQSSPSFMWAPKMELRPSGKSSALIGSTEPSHQSFRVLISNHLSH